MGRKGGGRKAFLKSAKPPQDELDDSAASHIEAPPQTDKEAQSSQKEDPSAKFLHAPSPNTQASETTRGETTGQVKDADTNGRTNQAETSQIQDETRGQLIQRHKKEMKAHKEQMKKLGKKKKDEIEQLDKEIETRHNNELLAWESSNTEEDLSNTSLVAPSVGLYDLTIGDSEEKQTKKPTKAQKRREQRAVEEAEREARIKAEKSALGPDSEQQLEAEELASLLEPQGLTVKDIPADGHCMYRSVQDQLQANAEEPGLDYTELRQETASYMRAFPDNFLPFINMDEESGKDAEQQFEEYCDKIEETAAWGGQVELQALAQAIERHIMVHCAGLPLVELGTEYKGKHLPLQICYLRHAYTLGEHYNSVQAIKSQ